MSSQEEGPRPVCGRTASKPHLFWRRRYGKTRIPTLPSPWLLEPSGRGYFPGAFNGGDATVKDSKRFADTGGWGYFNFTHHEPKALTAKVKDKSECAFCHIASAKRDEVWTQFYRILDEVPLPQGGRG